MDELQEAVMIEHPPTLLIVYVRPDQDEDARHVFLKGVVYA